MSARANTHRGEGAVLGVRVLRNSGVQGVAMLTASALHLVMLFIVAHYLGPAELGRFAVLYFGAGAMAQLLMIAVKPGTIRRTFAESDDEDGDDEEGDDDVSDSPKRSLGTGLTLAALLSTVGFAVVVALREPIAAGLLGDRGDSDLVVWAAVLGGTTVLFKLASIVVWFERRPTAFLACELSRPIIAIGAVTALLATGAGIEAVLIGGAAGALAGALVGLFVLRHSFELAFDRSELGPILHRGMQRAPIMSSFWGMGNADVFLLSRFVSDADLGIYTLASRAGFIAAFLPQGFRVALRPLRKASIYKSVEKQYGRAEQRGQLLGYFVLLCVSAVLAMVLLAPIVVEFAPESFADAAPLIPVTAGAMVLPALLRTVNQQTNWKGRTRMTFVASAVGAFLLFVAATLLFAPAIGNYAAPAGMIAGLLPPALYMFLRCQRGNEPIRFPYREVGTALGVALAIGSGYVALGSLLPLGAKAALALAGGALYVGLLFALRVVPESHWEALAHMVRSLVSGRPDRLQPRRGIRALEAHERDALRVAVRTSWAARTRVERRSEMPTRDVSNGDPRALTRALRTVGNRGGVPVKAKTRRDGEIGEYLFSSAPTAIRNAAMRKLLDDGADVADLRALEDLVAHLATVPDAAWAGERKYGGP